MRFKMGIISIWIILVGCTSFAMANEDVPVKTGDVKSLEDRIEKLEAAVERQPESDKWYDRIQISGLIEVEAATEKINYNDPATPDERSSDVDLTAVELAFDAKIVTHVGGHVMIKYEEDEIFVDEGFITFTGNESFPAYLIAGRQYIPFGNYSSHFVTDPTTLVLGETNEGAAVAGYQFGQELLDVSIGFFNSRTKKNNKDDVMDSFVASVAVELSENLLFGGSYTSNLAGSDSLNAVVVDPDNLESLVDGWSAFVNFSFLERFTLIGEYVGAMDRFNPGELYDAAETKRLKPSAWNVELGIDIVENLEVAARYGGASDGGSDFLPKKEYGAVINWHFFKTTNLALEYIRAEFENDNQKTDTVVTQLAIEF